MRLPVPFRRLADSFPSSQELWLPNGRTGFVRDYWKWWSRVRFGAQVSLSQAPGLTVILLSYRRPHNMDALVRSALQCSFVERVVVSNNNPIHSISEWVRVRDDRLILIDQPEDTGAVERYFIAAAQPGTYFLSYDDDLFLSPEQIAHLYKEQLKNPHRIHGFFGQRVPFPYAEDTIQYSVHSCECDVDIVNRCYLFTDEHVRTYHSLLQRIGAQDSHAIRRLSVADDVILSCCAALPPRIHNIGSFLDCPTASKPGVAQYQLHHFKRDRLKLYVTLKGMCEAATSL